MDTYILEMWVQSLALIQTLRKELKVEGQVSYSVNGAPCVNPKRQALHSEQSLWAKLNIQLCLDPKSRENLRRTILANESAQRALEGGEPEEKETSATRAAGF
jgi:phage terminase small subunit